MFRKLYQFPSLSEGTETPNLLGPLERANHNHNHIPMIEASSPHLKTETDPVSEKLCLPIV
jgi:hypothetical protein